MTRIFEGCDGKFREAGLRLVSGCHDIGQRQATHLHGDVAGDVRRLGENGDTTLDALHAVLVRPEQSAVKRIDEAIAIGADDRHVTGRRHQRILQVVAIGKLADGLMEPRCVADGAASLRGRTDRG
ncbi:hypothetical protein LP421_28790 [Rhizobium sp. RCAM05350]|nr:hypothetical protein LP421_28790 [Rhizobium sp. RCAM05350]